MIRIAMIGGGPKCLFALLALNDGLEGLPAPAVQVDVYDPYPPGAGRVWNTKQPKELRLNVNPRIIDASSSLCSKTFNQWCAEKGDGVAEDGYPPRALVGKYLAEQYDLLASRGILPVQHRAVDATGINRRGPLWEVESVQGTELYDEVVLATGHGLNGYLPPDSPEGSLPAAAFTVEHEHAMDAAVPAGSNVMLRGAALTAYDIVLHLTEGRGGTWERITDEGMEALLYRPGGSEPASITMTSRSGIPMTPKPNERPRKLERILDPYRDKVRRWGQERHHNDAGKPASNTQLDELWQLLLSCALECAEAMGAPVNENDLQTALQTGISTRMSAKPSPAEQLRVSLQINHGWQSPSPEWLWGTVWSGLYSQLVQALSRISWTGEERKQFKMFAANLERMAFGPPETTAMKLLALFNAGILKHERLSEAGDSPTHLVVDAVTAPAGVLHLTEAPGVGSSSLYRKLFLAGEVSIRAGERGLLTDTDGTCMDAAGERNQSLAAIGRPTEDPTLGHDTLNRELHPEYQRWAQRIVRQLAASQEKVVQ
ncbi:FAD/NAD(P)-binding protein [Glutamicibacter nicotianae]|uniref:FAD/NAD(P)-binding protein n=1 Tax=Glutamicibacter nicotianae TaxID=37929 RepID=UPI00195E76DA|nr:FAD/NAD(P)-binding domain-containing protein [Glutamicibacter nicotianae]MBM7766596.1 diaminopimelate decarboxylase [Glutamicibacter nicotianae]